MISLIFDTETTGFPSKDLLPDDPKQARIVQLAMLLLDNNNKEIGCFYSKFVPNGWNGIHPGAQAVHGITYEDCERTGIQQKVGLELYYEWVGIADNVVAHNYHFDRQLINIETALLSIQSAPVKQSFCTMEILVPHMKLLRPNGLPKWPKLSEALDWCIPGATIDKEHDALGDVRATAKVWTCICEKGLCSTGVLGMIN